DVDADLELAHAGDKVWLVKLPRFLFERWENCAEGTDLGTLKINEANRRDMKVVLSPELQGGDSKDGQPEIPVEYALEMINSNLHNTYVFSEPPLPPLQSGQAIRGRVVHDCLVKPVDNLHYRNLLRGRTTAADVPRRRVISMNDNGTNFIQPGQLGGSKSFNTFIQSKTGQAVKCRDVNARLPLKDLYDAIFKCFEEYEFWSLKAFKKKLKQPEAYLKDTLDNIATLHKRGPHVGTWELKQETK
ncbi:transcription initiation factor IIF, beta subunit, partial [Protomyces lactucae-debilis]